MNFDDYVAYTRERDWFSYMCEVSLLLRYSKHNQRNLLKIAMIWSSLKLSGGQGRRNSCFGKDSLERKNETASNESNYKKSHIRILPQSSAEVKKVKKICLAQGFVTWNLHQSTALVVVFQMHSLLLLFRAFLIISWCVNVRFQNGLFHFRCTLVAFFLPDQLQIKSTKWHNFQKLTTNPK